MEHGESDNAFVDQVRVSDLELAAYLTCQGARLLEIRDTAERGRCDFVLSIRDEILQQSMRKFMSGQARVEPRRYAQSRRILQKALRSVADDSSRPVARKRRPAR